MILKGVVKEDLSLTSVSFMMTIIVTFRRFPILLSENKEFSKNKTNSDFQYKSVFTYHSSNQVYIKLLISKRLFRSEMCLT